MIPKKNNSIIAWKKNIMARIDPKIYYLQRRIDTLLIIIENFTPNDLNNELIKLSFDKLKNDTFTASKNLVRVNSAAVSFRLLSGNTNAEMALLNQYMVEMSNVVDLINRKCNDAFACIDYLRKNFRIPNNM